MTSGMLDSKPVFLSRLESSGLEEDAVQRLIAGGLDTLAKLAYLAPVSPSSGDDRALMEALKAVMQYDEATPMPVMVQSCLRRIWFESHATAISEVKTRLERGDESQPRKLPLPEREDRRQKQQKKISGFKIEGVHEPSNSLIDLVHTMREDQQLKYISPEQCTHRTAELGGVKKEVFMQSDSGGRLKQVNREIPPEADVSNSYKLRLALLRRSLALDQMGLAEFDKFESYVEYLFEQLMQEPPAGYAPFSVPQLIAADKMIWQYMSTHCRSGITQRADGSYPIHEELDAALRSPLILAALQPLPRSKEANWKRHDTSPYDRKGGKGSASSQPFKSNFSDYPYKGGKGNKGGGKGKKGLGKKNFRMPVPLDGGHAVTKDGARICFGFNLGQCTDKNCRRGSHVCCLCEAADHAFNSCPKKN
jgi:hypothetical protein